MKNYWMKKKSKPYAVKAQHIGLLILDSLGIVDKKVKSVEAVFQTNSLDYSFFVITQRECNISLHDHKTATDYYHYQAKDMRQLGLDLLRALDIDSTGVTGFRICCAGVDDIATVEISKNIVPDDDQLKHVLTKLKQEE